MPNRIWVRRTDVDANGQRVIRIYCCRSKSNTCTKAHLSYSGDFDDSSYGEGLADATTQVNAVFDQLEKDNKDPGRELSVLILPNGKLVLAWTVVEVEGEECQCADDEVPGNIEEALSLQE